jgi:hypothetical protein
MRFSGRKPRAGEFSDFSTLPHFESLRPNSGTHWGWGAFHKFTTVITTTRVNCALRSEIQNLLLLFVMTVDFSVSI